MPASFASSSNFCSSSDFAQFGITVSLLTVVIVRLDKGIEDKDVTKEQEGHLTEPEESTATVVLHIGQNGQVLTKGALRSNSISAIYIIF